MAAAATIAVVNRKGGVGKTTTAVHLAAALGRLGRRVLVVDMDAQANATLILSDDETERESIGDVASALTRDVPMRDVIRPSTSPGVHLAPTSYDAMREAIASISPRANRSVMLKRALAALGAEYEFIIIDTPYEANLGTENAVIASTHVLVPFAPDPTALHGAAFVHQMVADVSDGGLGAPRIVGLVQTAYDKRMQITEQAREQVRREFGGLLLETCIRANAKFMSCAGWHRDVFALEQEQSGGERRGTADYQALADELLPRLEAR